MKIRLQGIAKQFRNRRTISKMICDAILMSLVSFLVFWLLPQKVVFFELASAHTTNEARAVHSIVAILAVFFCRSALVVYGAQWHATRTYQFLTIVVADMMAGILYYIITEFILGSVYPFLLTVSLFALFDIASLFIRLAYKGLCEEYFALPGNKASSAASNAHDH